LRSGVRGEEDPRYVIPSAARNPALMLFLRLGLLKLRSAQSEIPRRAQNDMGQVLQKALTVDAQEGM
jgi:hypothetical protein